MQHADHQQYVLPALLALLVFGTAIIVLTSGSSAGDALRPSSSVVRGEKPRSSGQKTATKVVMVRAGDTPTSIADGAGISLARLFALNPKLDPRTLRPGQRLKLAR